MQNIIKKTAIILTVMIFGIGFYAYADMGWGYHHGPGMMYGDGYGMYGHHGGWYDQGDTYSGLTDEQIKAIENQRSAFIKSTDEIRRQIYEKDEMLNAELSKETPDVKKAVQLQKDVSALKAQLDQKAIEYRLAVKKINPDIVDRYDRGFGGYGHHGYHWRGCGF